MSAVLSQPEVKQRLTGNEFIKIATKYARKVVKGKYQCRTMKLACQHYLDDLREQKKSGFQYYLDPDKVAHVCWFAENMPHIKGKLSKLPFPDNLIKLEPFQVFILANLFGWLDKNDGLRRYRQAYIKIPRKNGKSVLAAIFANYMFAADGESGAEVYVGATSEKQANEVFVPAKEMTVRSAKYGYCKRFGITINAHSLTKQDSSKFMRLVGNPGDGGSPHGWVFDEYHEAKNDNLLNTMKTGELARDNSMGMIITTAGTDISLPCYSYEMDCISDLEKGKNDRRFIAIWGIDDEKDWKSISWLKAANPNFGVSVIKKDLLADLAEAIRKPEKQTIFKQKHCNIWTSGAGAYFNMEHWNAAADTSLKEEDFAEDERFHGIDIASIEDIASDVRIYRRLIESAQHYYIFGNHYVPAGVRDDPELKNYVDWIEQGYLTETEGNKINHFEIGNNVLQRNANTELNLLGYDGFQAEMLTTYLSNGNDEHHGIDVERILKVVQSKKYLSDPMKFISAELKAGTIHHDGNLAMKWMMSNVMVRNWDYLYSNFAPIKANRQNKIDGPVAMLIAVAVMLSVFEGSAEAGVFYV